MTTTADAPDYNLTCWYLNQRRVIELVGVDAISPRLQAVERMSSHQQLQHIAVQSVFKDAITEWLATNRPPTLGELVISDTLAAGRVFTHYTNWFFKSLTQVRRAEERGVTPLPPALAYAQLDTLRPDLRVECRFHAEHLTANSSWTELSGQKTKFVMGLITGVNDGLIEAVPYVVSDLAPGFGRSASLIGRAWHTKLEVFIDQIDSFAAVAETEHPRRRADLNLLRDIPEADVKRAIADILGEPTVPKDWGGERSDLFTTHVHLAGRRLSTAFAFKGPAKFKPMTMAELGKNGDQIDRLYTEPADLVVLQHCHEAAPVRGAMRAYAQRMGDLRLFCIIDGYDTLRLLQAYGKCDLGTPAPAGTTT
ncbi:hypothetical protein JNW90_26060 [Micromonospora sp. STR1s_5]|nr:hypothetical protein [Micromonospora sp. STR1s_5]